MLRCYFADFALQVALNDFAADAHSTYTPSHMRLALILGASRLHLALPGSWKVLEERVVVLPCPILTWSLLHVGVYVTATLACLDSVRTPFGSEDDLS